MISSRPNLFAFSFVVQGWSADPMAVLVSVDARSRAVGSSWRRPLVDIVRSPVSSPAFAHRLYPMMNLVMTSAPVR